MRERDGGWRACVIEREIERDREMYDRWMEGNILR